MTDNTKHEFVLTAEQKAKQQQIIDQVREGSYKPELSLLEEEYMGKAMVR